MSVKKTTTTKSLKTNESAGTDKQIQKLFCKINHLYELNNRLWTAITELQNENNTLQQKLKEVA